MEGSSSPLASTTLTLMLFSWLLPWRWCNRDALALLRAAAAVRFVEAEADEVATPDVLRTFVDVVLLLAAEDDETAVVAVFFGVASSSSKL